MRVGLVSWKRKAKIQKGYRSFPCHSLVILLFHLPDVFCIPGRHQSSPDKLTGQVRFSLLSGGNCGIGDGAILATRHTGFIARLFFSIIIPSLPLWPGSPRQFEWGRQRRGYVCAQSLAPDSPGVCFVNQEKGDRPSWARTRWGGEGFCVCLLVSSVPCTRSLSCWWCFRI